MKKSEALRILGLSEGATDDEVKAAHRKKVVESHPDQFAFDSVEAKQAEEKTKRINEARDVLLSRKWEPEYAYRGPYANPYGTSGGSNYSGQGRPGGNNNPFGDWPFGQGQGQPSWVWTSWEDVVGEQGEYANPFRAAQAPQKSAKELKDEAKKSLSYEIIVIAIKLILLIVLSLTGLVGAGAFLYVIISVVYGLWKRLGGCLITFFVPIALMLIPLMIIIAPQAGAATIGLIAASFLCFAFDINNVYKAFRRYRQIKVT